MARPTEIPTLRHRPSSSNPTVIPPKTSPQTHTEFTEVRVHTAKCDSCERHNKLSLYRCMECGQHVCSSCWKKSGDRTHVFGGGSRNAQSNNESKNGSGTGEKGHENASRTRTKRRAYILSDDDDDDIPVLKPGSVTENTEAVEASTPQRKRTNIVMNGDQHQGHEHGYEDDRPSLWPMVPARGLTPLRPAVPTVNTSATKSANPAMQENTHIRRIAKDPERQRNAEMRMQRTYVSASDHETHLAVPRPSRSFVSNQPGTGYADHVNLHPAYRPRLGSDLDKQAASPRNQLAFPNSQISGDRAARHAQPSIAAQQAPRQSQPSLYRPRPEANLDMQTPHNQLSFAPYQNNSNHQAPRPGQIFIPHQQGLHPAPRSAHPSVFVSQNPVQTTANTDQVAARDPQRALYMQQLRQHAEAHAHAKAMEAYDRQALSLQQTARPAVNRDQLATQTRQAISSNQLSSSAVYYEQMIAARDRQQAYLLRQQTNRPTPGSAQFSISQQQATQQRATQLSFPSPAFLSQMHAASRAPHPVQQYSPEAKEAADALLLYARAEPNPRDHSQSENDTNGDSHSLNAAGRPRTQSAAPSESGSPSTPLASPFGAAGPQSMISPRGFVSSPSPRGPDPDSLKARVEKHRQRLAGLQSLLGTHTVIPDTPDSQRGHASHIHPALQPNSENAFANSSAVNSHGSRFRSVRSHSGSMPPISDHAAAYLDQWDAGRAALSSMTSNTAGHKPAPQPESPRSGAPAIDIQDTAAGGKEAEDVVEASIQAPSTPIPVPEGPNDVDVVMGSPGVTILESNQSHSSEVQNPGNNDMEIETKHSRAENNNDNDKFHTKKKHKAPSSDVQVIDPSKRDIQVATLPNWINNDDDDDDDDDLQITSWNKRDSNPTTTNRDSYRGADAKTKGNAKAKEVKLDRVMKRGVAYVKKPEPKKAQRKVRKTSKLVAVVGLDK